MSVLRQRFLLVSDMHYTTEETAKELKISYPDAIASVAAGNAFGKTQREKVEKIYRDICEENRRARLDAVLVLGDLSIDDPDYRNLPWNYCQRFKEECMDLLPCASYAIPGNHDSYPDALWREVFGYDRQYVVEIDGSVFIMADTFAALPAKNPSGSGHSPLDEMFVRTCLERYKGKRIFLCAHYLDTQQEENRHFTDGLRNLVKDNEDLLFLYRGHTHINSVTDMGEGFGNKKIIDIGGYGYEGQLVNGKWDFNIFDYQWAWGYQILEVYDDKIRTYHVKTDMHYVATNGIFEVSEAVEGETEILI